MTDEPPRYLAYMLRIWQASAGGNLSWRATLESPHTGERHGFADLKSLYAFLDEKTRHSAVDAAVRNRAGSQEAANPPQMVLDSLGAEATQQRMLEPDAAIRPPDQRGAAPPDDDDRN